MNKLILLSLILIFGFITANSQNFSDKEINAQFENGLSLYQSGDYQQAYDVFNTISSLPDYNHKTTASEVFKIKILVELDNTSDAKKLAENFLERYSASSYVDEVRILLVQSYILDEEYSDALFESVRLFLTADDSEYREESKHSAEIISTGFMTASEIEAVASQFQEAEVKSFLLLQEGKSYLRQKDIFSAKSIFSDLMNKYPGSAEYETARQLYQTAGSNSESVQNIIGVMLPLNTNNMNMSPSPGEEILEGIKYAVSEFNRDRDEKTGILIRDTENDPERINEIRDEFGSLSEVKVILGPVFSNEVRIAIDEFNNTDIPIISPTATDDDLASLSENFFQANPSFSIRGKLIAQYIYFVENKRNLAILNSIDGYSPILAANFAEEFESLGGSILTRQSYKSKAFDMKDQVDAINVYRDTLDGIYIPLSNSIDAPTILSQMVQDSLQIPIFGNQDWLTVKGFETSSELSNKITFTSDYFIDYNSDDLQLLSKSYSSVTGKDVNRNFLYGYDAAKYILTVMRNINSSRANIRSKMLTGLVVNGLHNNISFGEERINHFLDIVRYKDGIFELVDKFRYGR